MSDAGHCVVAIGDLLWDLLPSGRQLGGASANFAYHAGQLGARAALASQVGVDELGDEALAFLKERHVNVDNVLRDPEHPTSTVSIELEDGGVPIFTVHENVAWDFLACPTASMEIAATADAVFFGTLAQRSEVSRRTIGRLLDATTPSCLRLFDVNLRQDYYDADLIAEALTSASVLKASEEELRMIGRLMELSGDPAALPRNVADAFSLTAVAVTRGPRGALLRVLDEQVQHSGFAAVADGAADGAGAGSRAATTGTEAGDTVGAGDAFGAALCVGLLRGDPPGLIVENANRLAAYVCSQPGAMPPIPDDLKESLIPTT